MKLLIADDDATSRYILESAATKWGFHPVVVEDGLKTLEVMSGPDAPGLILLDWEMPGLDGLSIARHLTSTNPEHPPYIIMLTARDNNNDIVSGLAAGASDYITKPFEIDILKARLQLARRNLELQNKLNKAMARLETLANVDELTGLPNRRAALKAISTQINRSKREQDQLCIGLCDIDFFKEVNDGHGHAAGDDVLKEIAGLLEEGFRDYDVIGRYGGEEFIFAVSANMNSADVLLERIRASINQATFMLSGQSHTITMSFGAVMVSNDGKTLDDWILYADEALYHSKASGRNRVTFYESDYSQDIDSPISA
ncbi:MAG: diguanylate cyclase [Methylophaga sp.]|nr:diguanylate cyclase [Methylophaga sp.]